ncbi:two-component sensor histidine kinase [Siminovitchia terrae]|uniref:histidine kinase n=1 Tax=Siminovitchia terrae TaxID=1914933 RepID=A0ABQ4L3X9_SIMTE|nr:HAMP domain-containing sensor histidine kinase [Siminovitchia terrae]GIN98272.1 two-component sensor histidine kinase [Siminovitchia terrae]
MKMGLSRKMSMALLLAFTVSTLYASFFSYFLYERLYVNSLKTEMLDTGRRLAYSYDGGAVTESFIDEVNWFGEKSQFEVFAVQNPRELSMCLPFEVDYQALISGEDRETLLKGEAVYKKGHVERLDRDVISVIIPLLDGKRLEGVIYLYYPLANLSEMILHYSAYWFGGAILFLLIALTMGNKWLKRAIRPLKEMQTAAKDLSGGNLSVRVADYPDDEIGQLAHTFNEMAESIQKEDEKKKEFLANVSHELRTPLSFIKGYAEAVQTGVAAPEDREKYNRIILREAARMERLVEDLLDLAKFESKEFTLNKMPTPLAQTIEESIEKVKQRVSQKGVHLECKLNYDLIAEVDEGRLEQMVLNLLDNAIRHTEKSGTITVSLTLKDEAFALITITDTGQGIPVEDLKKIKERFYRVNKARTRKEGGTGLGLPIVESLAKLHGGSFHIESEYGKGTAVYVSLPIIPDTFQ